MVSLYFSWFIFLFFLVFVIGREFDLVKEIEFVEVMILFGLIEWLWRIYGGN